MSKMLLEPRAILSSRYQRKWGLWEAFREVYCNALDEDPDGMIVDVPNANKDLVTVFTRTAPTLPQLCIIGEGTKEEGGTTIGQFGEGLKLSAVTLLRLGGSMRVETADFVATYELREEPGCSAPILWCVPKPSVGGQGCRVIMTAPGANWKQFLVRFCDQKVISLGRANATPRIFCKGVFVTTSQTPALHNYNLNGVSLNRDRNVPDHYTVLRSITMDAMAEFSVDTWVDVLQSPEIAQLELEALSHYESYVPNACLPYVKEAWDKVFGESGILMTDPTPTKIERVEGKGFKPVIFAKQAHALLLRAGVRDQTAVLPKGSSFSVAWHPATPEHMVHEQTVRDVLKYIDHVPKTVMIRFCNESSLQVVPCDDEPDRMCLWISKEVAEEGEVALTAAALSLAATIEASADVGSLKFTSRLSMVAGMALRKVMKEVK